MTPTFPVAWHSPICNLEPFDNLSTNSPRHSHSISIICVAGCCNKRCYLSVTANTLASGLFIYIHLIHPETYKDEMKSARVKLRILQRHASVAGQAEPAQENAKTFKPRE